MTRKLRADEAIRNVERIDEIMGHFTPSVLRDYARRAAMTQEPDGYPQGGGGAGGGGAGGSGVSRPTENVALAAVPEFDDQGRMIRPGWRAQPDPQGTAIETMWSELAQAKRHLETAERARHLVVHIGEDRRGRESSVSTCLCCDRTVTGVGEDRLKAGLAPACYKAWERDGRPERQPWIATRRRASMHVVEDADTTVAALQGEAALPSPSAKVSPKA